MRSPLPALFVLLCTMNVARAHPREMVLAGGALHPCTTLAADDCVDPAVVRGVDARREPTYRVDAAASAELRAATLQLPGVTPAWIEALRHAAGSDALSRDAMVDVLERACASTDAPCTPPWSRMTDAERDAVLGALEVPQIDAGVRRRETAALDGAKLPHAATILRAFVDAAAKRSPGKPPRIAIVTAASFDPFDPVDAYVALLEQAGAQVTWWPVDASLNAAVFEAHDCDALPRLRRERLQLAGRERVYADLGNLQQQACREPRTLAAVPDGVQGIFFTGGDQGRLRRAFVDARGRPNVWLRALQGAVARGDVVVSGTSAGSAVQSGGPMIGSGESRNAVRDGAHRRQAPVAGCSRSTPCDEDALTWEPAGMELAPGLVIDTHFARRARELRLVQLLADSGARRGIGVDETSAVHLQWQGGEPIVETLGATGAWLFDVPPECEAGARIAHAAFIAPGARWTWRRDGRLRANGPLPWTPPAAMPPLPDDAFASDALHQAAVSLALDGAPASRTLHADAHAVRLSRAPSSQHWRVDDGAVGITGLTLTLDNALHCSR